MRIARRCGFSLIEVVLAAFVFAIGVLALEATALSSLRRMRRSAQMGLAASIAKSRLEMLAASRCAELQGGSDTLRSIISTWTIDPGAASASRVVSQTVSYTVDGSARTDAYRSVVPCSQ